MRGPGAGWRGVGACAAVLAVLSCGRTTRDWPTLATAGASNAASGGMSAASGGMSAASGGMSAASGGMSAASGGMSAASGGSAGAFSSSAGSGGATGGNGSSASLDPKLSLQWQWEPCGEVLHPAKSLVAAAYSPSAEEVAASYTDGSVVLHSADASKPDRLLLDATVVTSALAFSSDGSLLAEARPELGIRRLSDDVLTTVAFEQSALCEPERLFFSPDDARLMSWNAALICVWDSRSGALLAQLREASLSAGLAHDGILLASAVAGQVAVSTLSLPSLVREPVELEGLDGPAAGVVVSPSGDSITASSQAASSFRRQLWSGEGTLLAMDEPVTFGEGHSSVYSADGAHVLLGSRVFNARSGAAVLAVDVLPDHAAPILLNGAGTHAVGASLSSVAVYDLRASSEMRVFSAFVDSSRPELTLDLAVAPEGNLLALATSGDLLVWKVRTPFNESQLLRAHASGVLPFKASFSPDGAALLTSGDGWSLASAASGLRSAGSPPPPGVSPANCNWTLARFSPRGSWLAVGGYGPLLQIRGPDGAELLTEVPLSRCNAIAAFSSDETVMATPGPELYRTRDWTRIGPPLSPSKVEVPFSPFGDVQFIPGDRQLLVSRCQEGDESLYSCHYALHSAETGALLRSLPELRAHQAKVSPEGHWVASGSQLLHLPSGEARELGDEVQLAAFTPAGDIIAVAADNSLRRYCR